MDYKTKPLSRKEIRKMAIILRKRFHIDPYVPFPVLEILDKLSDVFKGCKYVILPDEKFPKNVKARCCPNNEGGFTIEIPEYIYEGAYQKKIGAYLGFICHEICHIFLFKCGFTPYYERCFHDRELRPYESIEWQAKALSGEVMMPYETTQNRTVRWIMSHYNVSKGFATTRQKY